MKLRHARMSTLLLLSVASASCATQTSSRTVQDDAPPLYEQAGGQYPLWLSMSAERVEEISARGLGPTYDALYARLQASDLWALETVRGDTLAEKAASRENLLRNSASYWATVGMTAAEWDRLAALGENPADAIAARDRFDGPDAIKAALTLNEAPVLASLRDVTDPAAFGSFLIEARIEDDLKDRGVPDVITFGRPRSSGTMDTPRNGRCILFLSKGRYEDRIASIDPDSPFENASMYGPGPYLETTSPLCQGADGRFHQNAHHRGTISISEDELREHMAKIAP